MIEFAGDEPTESTAQPSAELAPLSPEVEENLSRIIERVYGSRSVGWLSPVEQLRQIEFLARELKRFPQREAPTRHHFVPGGIAREIIVPADTILIGGIHKLPQINVFSEGEVSMLTPTGMVRMKAPFTFVTPAGTQRVGYTHTRMVWTNFVAVDAGGLTDANAIAEMLTYPSVDAYLASLPPLPDEPVAQLEGPSP